ncbi:MAG: FKBP-type peptidyl-prolyl cis-trans isomerase [Bacteroidetes bacterium]|nr:FKBP-type peptidyl-prolyl cis-trans isomerase [Bacteroidota bacterium]
MTISEKQVVSVNYHLTVPGEDGGAEITIEKTSLEDPFVFLFGGGQLLPEFEQHLSGKKSGDKFDFKISAENGYGTYQIDHIVNLPIENFLDKSGKLDTEMIAVGKNVPMMSEDGHRMWGKILEVALQHVRMDFNHPLAGKELHFNGEVLNVREASNEEMEHGHVHGPGGHHH